MDGGGFRSAIQNILNRWSGLKLSVEHQSGGRQSKEKALYLIDYLHEVLLSNSKVEQEDFEDLISDYMDNEMQTILEDDSVREIARTMLHLFDLYQTKGEEGLAQEINKLPHCDVWLDITYPIPTRSSPDESSNDDSGSETEEVPKNQGEEMDCEWTEIELPYDMAGYPESMREVGFGPQSMLNPEELLSYGEGGGMVYLLVHQMFGADGEQAGQEHI